MEAVLIGFGIMLVLAFIGVPLAFAMLMTGIVGFTLFRGFPAAVEMAGQTIMANSTNYNFTVVPMFLLMGNFIFRADLSSELYRAGYAWLGHRRGGLAMATILACGAFSTVSGTSVATAATMAKVAMPEMRRYGYSDELAAGSLAAGGTLGILIPPSVVMVLYGLLTETDIGKLFMAGLLPGILTVLLYMLVVASVVRLRADAGPAGERTPLPARLRSLAGVWGVLVLFVLVLGGIYVGAFTPNEAAAIGAVGALVICLLRRRLTWRGFIDSLFEAGWTSSMLFAIGFGALVLGNLVEVTGMSRDLVAWVNSAGLTPHQVLALIILFYLLLGCVFDSIGMVLLTVPVFGPLVAALGFDMVWFGIVVVVVTEIGLITPPIGMNAFVLKSVIPRITLATIFRGIAPFWSADVVRILLLVAFPQISLLLPRLMT